jgi:CRISPR/Cas system-associated protein Csm6
MNSGVQGVSSGKRFFAGCVPLVHQVETVYRI